MTGVVITHCEVCFSQIQIEFSVLVEHHQELMDVEAFLCDSGGLFRIQDFRILHLDRESTTRLAKDDAETLIDEGGHLSDIGFNVLHHAGENTRVDTGDSAAAEVRHEDLESVLFEYLQSSQALSFGLVKIRVTTEEIDDGLLSRKERVILPPFS